MRSPAEPWCTPKAPKSPGARLFGCPTRCSSRPSDRSKSSERLLRQVAGVRKVLGDLDEFAVEQLGSAMQEVEGVSSRTSKLIPGRNVDFARHANDNGATIWIR